MTTSFADLGLPRSLVAALDRRRIVAPFPIQAAAIPDALAGRDVCGKAPTGSGKTLAFGLPLLTRIDRAELRHPRALVLAPTRELAEQIKRDLVPLAEAAARSVYAVYGGVGYGPQKTALRRGVDVLVATPGRLEDLVDQRAVSLGDASIVVVDEADRMADMGFLPDVRRLLDRTPQRRQTLLFSATLDGDIAVLSRDYQRDPIRHEAGTIEPEADAEHRFLLVDHHERVRHAADLVTRAGRSIVFTRTRHGADRLTKQLGKLGVGAVAMHGGRTQNQRTRALAAFSAGKAQALIATDVAARGIHVEAVASVIHFDPPADAKDYLHRSGRTARAGAPGTVISLVTGAQRRAARRLQNELGMHAPIEAADATGPDGGAVAKPDRSRRAAAPPRPEAAGATGRKAPATKPRGGVAARRVERTEGDEPDSIYVANLPWKATSAEISALFGRHGTVRDATVITDRRSGRSKGFGFVDMDPAGARRAIAALHGSVLGGRDLTVRFAQPRRYGR